jgi:CRISPR/Cas system CMR-associated protein Cmr3 (group 5 of RAMP superfamily)
MSVNAIIEQKVVGSLVDHVITVAVIDGGLTINQSGDAAGSTEVAFSNTTEVHIVHNKNKKVQVAIIVGNEEVAADINRISLNDFYVNFSTVQTGSILYI